MNKQDQRVNRLAVKGQWMLAKSRAVRDCKPIEPPCRYDVHLFDVIIDRMKREILADMASGRVPGTVTTFSELHDHVDANEYGGFCDDANGPFGGFWSADWCTWFVNAAQDEIHKWLQATQPSGLYCTCCGSRFEGRRWWNMDLGHGLCVQCWNLPKTKACYPPDQMQRTYGHYGYNCILPRDAEVLAEQPTL